MHHHVAGSQYAVYSEQQTVNEWFIIIIIIICFKCNLPQSQCGRLLIAHAFNQVLVLWDYISTGSLETIDIHNYNRAGQLLTIKHIHDLLIEGRLLTNCVEAKNIVYFLGCSQVLYCL